MSQTQSQIRVLSNAIETGDVDTVNQILANNPSLDLNFPVQARSASCLNKTTDLYCKTGEERYFNIIKSLIEHGAEINYIDDPQYCYTPLHTAIIKKQYNLTKYLLENGANPNQIMRDTDDLEYNPLVLAVDIKDIPILMLLLEHPKIRLNAWYCHRGINILMYALIGSNNDCDYYSDEVVDLLTKYVDITECTDDYYYGNKITVLHFACLYDRRTFITKMFMRENIEHIIHIGDCLPYEASTDDNFETVSKDTRNFFLNLMHEKGIY